MVGNVHGRLTVVRVGLHLPNGRKLCAGAMCRCACGTVVPVRVRDLRNGNTRSCGCSHLKDPRLTLIAGTVASPRGCWEWTGRVGSNGYGTVCGGRIEQSAHRLAWIMWRGTIPQGLWVLHCCDNRRCVNPSHLYVGTRKDNVQDAVVRMRFQHGQDRFNARFCEDDVLEIRMRQARGQSICSIANQFQVSKNAVYKIVRHRTWRHLP